MHRVIRIIVLSIFISYFIGCTEKKESLEFKLPERSENLKTGFSKSLHPSEFMEIVNRGDDIQLIFLEDITISDTSMFVPLPGLKRVRIGEFIYFSSGLSKEKPLYIICMFGDDSKRLADKYKADGFNIYYVDGGMHRIHENLKSKADK